MNLYLISQEANNDYDTYNAAIVCAPNELAARNTHPNGKTIMDKEDWEDRYSGWCSSIEHVTAQYIGKAAKGAKPGVVLASFNAG